MESEHVNEHVRGLFNKAGLKDNFFRLNFHLDCKAELDGCNDSIVTKLLNETLAFLHKEENQIDSLANRLLDIYQEKNGS